MNSQDLSNLQEAYLDVYEGIIAMNPNSKYVSRSVMQNAEANRVGSKRFSDLGGNAALKAGGGQAALKSGSSVSDVLHAGKRAVAAKAQQDFNNKVMNKPQPPTQVKPPMDDFAAGGGNAKMKKTGMSRDQVVAQGKKNLTNSYDLYDIILSHLLDEGYAETQEQAEAIMVNMSEGWRESIVEEVLDEELTGERKKIALEKGYDVLARGREGSSVANTDDANLPTKRGGSGPRRRPKVRGGRTEYAYEADRGKGNKAARRAAALNTESYDLYDIILSHLLDEGYAETQEQAEAIMVNMSEDWRESIMEGNVSKKDAKTREKWYGEKSIERGTDRFSQLQKKAIESGNTKLF